MIIDIFTYSDASNDAAFSAETLIDAAKNAGLDGICITDKNASAHAKKLVAAGKNAGFFVGIGLEITTTAGRVTVFPKTLDADFLVESWKTLGDFPDPADVLNFFHEKGAVVVARDVFNRGEGLRDAVHRVKDTQGRGFDGVDTVAAYRRRIDNELSIEAQNVLGVPACAGSGTFDDIKTIGTCATLFTKRIRSQADFVDAMKNEKHWACTLRDLGDACPMGTPPRTDEPRYDRASDRPRDAQRQRGRSEHRNGDRSTNGARQRKDGRAHAADKKDARPRRDERSDRPRRPNRPRQPKA